MNPYRPYDTIMELNIAFLRASTRSAYLIASILFYKSRSDSMNSIRPIYTAYSILFDDFLYTTRSAVYNGFY